MAICERTCRKRASFAAAKKWHAQRGLVAGVENADVFGVYNV
jgi:hypothetical protein